MFAERKPLTVRVDTAPFSATPVRFRDCTVDSGTGSEDPMSPLAGPARGHPTRVLRPTRRARRIDHFWSHPRRPGSTCGTRNHSSVWYSDMSSPPVVILGGEQNALSAARSLGARGVAVYAVG